MKFNGIDPAEIHPCISVSKEIYPSMPARDIATVETASGDLVAHVSMQQDEATIRVNIAARTYDEAMEARLALAEWAASSRNATAELEPTHLPGKAYTAILKRMQAIENRFTTMDVVFLLPRPVLHEVAERRAAGSGTEMTFRIGGTAGVQPVFSVKLTGAAEGLNMTADGVLFFAISGSLSAGQTVEYNLQTGATTIDGVHAENRIMYAETDPDIELLPGKHTLKVSAAGSIQARWRNEWL